MKKTLAIFLSMAVAAPAGAAVPVLPAAVPAGLTRIGVAAAVRGSVRALAPGESAGRVIESGRPLFVNDHVTTGPQGRLQILLLDQTTFTLGPNSDMVLDEFVYDPSTNAGKLSARIIKGVFRFVSGKIAKHRADDMSVKLPSGTIGIRGTMVAGRVEGMNADVALLGPGPANNARENAGGIRVGNNTGAAVQIDRGGFYTTLRGDAPPSTPAPLTAGAMHGWIAKIDARSPSGNQPGDERADNERSGDDRSRGDRSKQDRSRGNDRGGDRPDGNDRSGPNDGHGPYDRTQGDGDNDRQDNGNDRAGKDGHGPYDRTQGDGENDRHDNGNDRAGNDGHGPYDRTKGPEGDRSGDNGAPPNGGQEHGGWVSPPNGGPMNGNPKDGMGGSPEGGDRGGFYGGMMMGSATDASGEGMAWGGMHADTVNNQIEMSQDQISEFAAQDFTSASAGILEGATTWEQVLGVASGSGKYAGGGSYACFGGSCGSMTDHPGIGDYKFSVAVNFGNKSIGGDGSSLQLITGPLQGQATGIPSVFYTGKSGPAFVEFPTTVGVAGTDAHFTRVGVVLSNELGTVAGSAKFGFEYSSNISGTPNPSTDTIAMGTTNVSLTPTTP